MSFLNYLKGACSEARLEETWNECNVERKLEQGASTAAPIAGVSHTEPLLYAH